MNIIHIEGSDAWEDGYRFGDELDKIFPETDADQLCAAVAENYNEGLTWEDLRTISDITLVQQGEHDEGAWIWHLDLSDGRKLEIEAWCDYTGWDCRSGIEVRER